MKGSEKKVKKIIIIGSRRRDSQEDLKLVWEQFRLHYEDGDVIISGGCPKGGDRFAEVIAKILGLRESRGELIIHRPNRPPKGSPKWAYTQEFYKRNTLVANEADENTVVIACVSPDRTGGTEDTLRKIKKRIDCKVVLV